MKDELMRETSLLQELNPTEQNLRPNNPLHQFQSSGPLPKYNQLPDTRGSVFGEGHERFVLLPGLETRTRSMRTARSASEVRGHAQQVAPRSVASMVLLLLLLLLLH